MVRVPRNRRSNNQNAISERERAKMMMMVRRRQRRGEVVVQTRWRRRRVWVRTLLLMWVACSRTRSDTLRARFRGWGYRWLSRWSKSESSHALLICHVNTLDGGFGYLID